MLGLIKSDLNKARKDKAILGILIALLAIALISFLSQVGQCQYMLDHGATQAELEFESVRAIFIEAFSLGINSSSSMLTILIPVITALLIAKEYSNGTYRNKCIVGIRREHSYLSTYFTTTCINIAIVLAYSAFGVLLNLTYFNWGASPYGNDFGMIITEISALVFRIITMNALFCAISLQVDSNPIVSALTGIVAQFGVMLCASFIPMLLVFIFGEGAMTTANVINEMNYLYQGTMIATFATEGVQFSLRSLLFIFLLNPAIAAGITAIGIRMFKKKDLK